MNEHFSISATIKSGKPKGLPFERIKNEVLGKRYTLSLVFIGEQRARTLNRTYRAKNTIPNVLAFPLSRTEGELFVCPNKARRDAAHFGMQPQAFIGYLFIHGLLHLKGYTHGSRMNAEERALVKRFDFV